MSTLKKLRREIDELDKQLLGSLAQRIKVCAAIGSAKKTQGLPVEDSDREEVVYTNVRVHASKLGLDIVGVESVYREIVNMCRSVQE